MSEGLEIVNKTKSTLPGVPFASIKQAILGKNYNLSLVFIGEKKSKELNRIYRNKDYPTNILSFPLEKNNGEIFITPSIAKKEASKFEKKYSGFIGLLFIHGLLHLKGMNHGSTMDIAEKKFQKKFRII